MHLLVPLIYVFRNFQLEYRTKYFVSMYLTLINDIHKPIVKYQYLEGEDEFFHDYDLLVN
jgi:hypothetical protein